MDAPKRVTGDRVVDDEREREQRLFRGLVLQGNKNIVKMSVIIIV